MKYRPSGQHAANGWINSGPHAEYVRRLSGWVATAIDLYADFASKARVTAVSRHGPAEHETSPLPWGHRLNRLLRKSCGMPQDLWQRTVLRYYLMTGNSYLYKETSSTGETVGLWPIPTQHVTLHRQHNGPITHLQIVGQKDLLPYEQVVHIRRPNQFDPYGEGVSIIGEHALTVELSDLVDSVRLQAFRTPRQPNWMFSSDMPLSDEDVQRNEARIYSKWGQRNGSESRPLFLDSGLKKIGDTTIGPEELDYLQTTRVTREETICGIFRAPMILAGFTEPGQPPTEGLIAGATTLFALAVVDPLLRAIYGQLVAELAHPATSIEAAITSTAPNNRNQERADEAVDRREGLRSVDEIRTARGLTPINENWSRDPKWRPAANDKSYSGDPAPNSQPTDQGNSKPGPKNSGQDTLAAPTAGDTPTG